MNRIRRRISARFTSEQEAHEDTVILDEQEQEVVIDALRREHALSSQRHYKFLQGLLSFTILLNYWFLMLLRPVTPVHVLFPNVKKPSPSLIPFATWFALLNIMMLLNVILHLPKDLSFPRVLHSVLNNLMSRLPIHIQEAARPHIPLPITLTACLCTFPPSVAVFTVRDIPQILWWSLPDIVIMIVVLVRSWIKGTSLDMEGLENMKYEAKGA